jgi:hypothetical protein
VAELPAAPEAALHAGARHPHRGRGAPERRQVQPAQPPRGRGARHRHADCRNHARRGGRPPERDGEVYTWSTRRLRRAAGATAWSSAAAR